MKAEAEISNDITGSSGKKDITAPLPVTGLSAEYYFIKSLSVYYNCQLFFINYDDKIKCELHDFILGLEYRIFSHFTIGAGFNKFSLDAKFKDSEKTLHIDTNWNGVMFYGSIFF